MGGSSGGGGSSGKIEYPEYLQDIHRSWMVDNTGTGHASHSMVMHLNEAFATNPFTGDAVFDPTTEVAAIASALSGLGLLVSGLDPETDLASFISAANTQVNSILSWPAITSDTSIQAVLLESAIKGHMDSPSDIATLGALTSMELNLDAFTSILSLDVVTAIEAALDAVTAVSALTPETDMDTHLTAKDSVDDLIDLALVETTLRAESDIDTNLGDETQIVADVSSFADQIDEQLEETVYPRFEGGMRDVNAVLSSAFVLGKSFIEISRNREVAKHASGLRLNLLMQKENLRGQAFIQEDRIRGEMMQLEANIVAPAYLQLDKYKGDAILAKLSAVTQAYINKDNLNAQGIIQNHQNASQAYIQFDKLRADAMILMDTFLGNAYIQQDKAMADWLILKHGKRLDGFLENEKIKFEEEKSEVLLKLDVAKTLVQLMQLDIQSNTSYTQAMLEGNRIAYVMQKEEAEGNIDLDERRERYEIETWQYAANLMGAVAGGTATPGSTSRSPSRTASAIGGAMSGAAMGGYLAAGTALGGPLGAVLGGMLGFAAGLL